MLALVGIALVLLATPGHEDRADYDAETEANFIEGCTADGRSNVVDVCECAYEAIEREIPFDRFQRVDERLTEDPDAVLPDDFLNLYTDCAIAAGGG